MVARHCGCRPRQCPDRRGPGKSRLPGISPLKLRPDRPARAALPTAPPKGVAGADGVSYRPQSFVRHPPRSAGRAARDRISSHHVGRTSPRAARLRNKYYFVYNFDGCGHGPGGADDGRDGRAIGDVRRRMVPWCAVLAGRAWLGCPAPAWGRQACAPDVPATSRACASAAGFGMVADRRSATRCPTQRIRRTRLSGPILAACRSHARP